jgi:t-SNARE complex subunit (syntaxin)
MIEMNDARIKSLQKRRYSEVSDRQHERNQKRIDDASTILSKLEEEVKCDTERLETAKELLSLAGSKARTEGCAIILRRCLKLLRESAEDAGLAEYYREQMLEVPDETVSEPVPAEKYSEPTREELERAYADSNDEAENGGNRGE